MKYQEMVQEMIDIGYKLYERELIVATEGNFSARIVQNRILVTPGGLCKGELQPHDFLWVDLDSYRVPESLRVSTEILMHLEVYRQRPDVRAIIHAHPPYCIALMLAGHGLDKPILAENVILLGKVPVVPYARPSTRQVPEAIRPYIQETDCLLLDQHGSLTLGKSLKEAFYKLELMEHTAKSYLAALQVGTVQEIGREEIRHLMELRQNVYRIEWPIIPFESESAIN